MNLQRKLNRHGKGIDRPRALKKASHRRRVIWTIEVPGRESWLHATKGYRTIRAPV